MTPVELAGRYVQLGRGKVVYVEPSLLLPGDGTYLKEDLLQIEYSNNLLLDAGFYGEREQGGLFRVVLIRDFEWERPLFLEECTDLRSMLDAIERAVALSESGLLSC